MTQSVISMIIMPSAWQLFFTILIISFIISILLLIIPKYTEEGKLIKKGKEYKPTRQDKLISLFMGIILLFLIVFILFLILTIVGNQLNVAILNCANCTDALA